MQLPVVQTHEIRPLLKSQVDPTLQPLNRGELLEEVLLELRPTLRSPTNDGSKLRVARSVDQRVNERLRLIARLKPRRLLILRMNVSLADKAGVLPIVVLRHEVG